MRESVIKRLNVDKEEYVGVELLTEPPKSRSSVVL
jgi:hypothetical protein